MTVALPPALRPWGTPLSLLHDVVVDGVGPWLSPLRELVGPMALPRSAHTGDPDGLSGLSPRGSYDRLVLAEWAVALEMPDEFVRRAVMGEHVFLSPAYREPHGARTSVALLDSGPLQLGAPRLAHLAALVVLAQRAELSKAEFRFGVLQDSMHRLHELRRAALTPWSEDRHVGSGRDDAAGWAAALREADAQDVWVVGHGGLQMLAGQLGAGLISVEEPLRAGERSLDVVVQRRAAPGGRLTLALPDEDTCLRTLRNPVRSTPQPRKRANYPAAPGHGLGQLTLRGDRLVVAGPDDSLHALHVPASIGGDIGRTKVIEAQYQFAPVAADIYSGRLVALCIRPDGSVCIAGSGLGSGGEGHSISCVVSTGLKAGPELSQSQDRTPLQFFVASATPDLFRAWIIDAAGALHEIVAPQYSDRTLVVRDFGCRNFARYGRERIAWASASERTILSSAGPLEYAPVLDPQQVETVAFGPWDDSAGGPVFAFKTDEETAAVYVGATPPRSASIPRGCTLLGVLRVADTRGTRWPLVVANAESTRVQVIGEAKSFSVGAPITAWRFCPTTETLLWRSEAGHVGVDAVRTHRTRLRLSRKGDEA